MIYCFFVSICSQCKTPTFLALDIGNLCLIKPNLDFFPKAVIVYTWVMIIKSYLDA